MSTHRFSILNDLIPQSDGDVYPEPSDINFGSNDLVPHLLWAFKDTSALEKLNGKFCVPKNYVGTAKLIFIFAVVPTTGDIRAQFAYKAIATGESYDPSAVDETVEVTWTNPGTARQMKEVSVNLTSANLAAGDLVQFWVGRDGTDAADTLAAVAYLVDALLEYNDA